MSQVGVHAPEGCRGCQSSASVRLAPAEVKRILAAYLASHPRTRLADEATHRFRMAVCRSCPDLQYGTTCRHCGCLVEVRTMLADPSCPASQPRWPGADDGGGDGARAAEEVRAAVTLRKTAM